VRRSLFLRLFLGLWAAVALLAAGLVATSPWFTRSRPGVERWQLGAERMLEHRVSEAAGRIAAGRPGDPREFAGRRRGMMEGRGLAPVHVLDPLAGTWDGPAPGEEIAAFALRVARDERPRSERIGVHHLAGRPVRAPDGRTLIVVAALRRPPELVDLLSPRALAGRLALLALLVALPSWWIARQIAAPVAGLRGAVRRLSGGDLAARVPAGAARRRDEIGDLARDFDAMAARLQTLVGAQQQLVRDVSHELRSPLARLRVALELARGRAGEAAAPALDRIELETERLDELVGGILTLSRLGTAGAPARRDPVDLAELVGEVAADAHFEAEARRVEVEVVAARGLWARGDRDALRSALDNVVRNAVRHAPEGTRVELSLAGTPEGAEIRVADRGPGVPEGSLGTIFEPFVRVESAREREPGGAGLGLAIAARAVRLHGGTIGAVNRPQGGLEVVLCLPAGPRPAGP